MTDHRDQNPYFDEHRRPGRFDDSYFDDSYFDGHRRSVGSDPDARATNAMWGWVAAAVFLMVVAAVAFGAGHRPGQSGTQTAFNTPAPPPAVTHMTPPTFAPAPVTPAPPISPAPNTPAQR